VIPTVADVVVGIAPTLLGAIGTGVIWLAKAVYKAKCDIDFAHHKIRLLEERLKSKE